jgi:tetratricopeptide (TPR) repeat protein
LVRAKRLGEAIGELRQAAELDADQVRYAYVYAVALNSAGRSNEAIAALKDNLARHPNDRDTLMALVAFYRNAADLNSALEYAEQLARITPNDRDLDNLILELRRQNQKPGAQ